MLQGNPKVTSSVNSRICFSAERFFKPDLSAFILFFRFFLAVFCGDRERHLAPLPFMCRRLGFFASLAVLALPVIAAAQSEHITVPGLGVSPLGLRILWRDGKRWKLYYTVKGGMIGFTQKALSNYGAYENFSLQQSVGMQFPLNDRLDLRAGVSDFHFSDAFLVPSNPGIDEMSWNGGLSYHFGSGSLRF